MVKIYLLPNKKVFMSWLCLTWSIETYSALKQQITCHLSLTCMQKDCICLATIQGLSTLCLNIFMGLPQRTICASLRMLSGSPAQRKCLDNKVSSWFSWFKSRERLAVHSFQFNRTTAIQQWKARISAVFVCCVHKNQKNQALICQRTDECKSQLLKLVRHLSVQALTKTLKKFPFKCSLISCSSSHTPKWLPSVQVLS